MAYYREREEHRKRTLARRDSEALDTLHRFVDGQEVSGADLTDLVIRTLNATGRTVRDPGDVEDDSLTD
jgi:hypothetical protein